MTVSLAHFFLNFNFVFETARYYNEKISLNALTENDIRHFQNNLFSPLLVYPASAMSCRSWVDPPDRKGKMSSLWAASDKQIPQHLFSTEPPVDGISSKTSPRVIVAHSSHWCTTLSLDIPSETQSQTVGLGLHGRRKPRGKGWPQREMPPWDTVTVYCVADIEQKKMALWFKPVSLNWWVATQNWVAELFWLGLWLRGEFPLFLFFFKEEGGVGFNTYIDRER